MGRIRPLKQGFFKRDVLAYNIDIDSKYMTVLNHEVCHAIDRFGSKDQHSKSKDFKLFIRDYKRYVKEKIKTLEKPQRDIMRTPYANGSQPSEVFARLCELWLSENDEILINSVSNSNDIFNKVVTEFYEQHEQELVEYFDTHIKPIALEKSINELIDETHEPTL